MKKRLIVLLILCRTIANVASQEASVRSGEFNLITSAKAGTVFLIFFQTGFSLEAELIHFDSKREPRLISYSIAPSLGGGYYFYNPILDDQKGNYLSASLFGTREYTATGKHVYKKKQSLEVGICYYNPDPAGGKTPGEKSIWPLISYHNRIQKNNILAGVYFGFPETAGFSIAVKF